MAVAESTPETDLLLQHFSGKRRWERVPCAREALIRGDGDSYLARTLDLSGGGALLEIIDPSFYETGATQGDAFHLVQEHLSGDLTVCFPLETVTVRTRAVRITAQESGHLCLGCEFERDLTASELVLLGVPDGSAAEAEALLGPLPLRALAGAPLSLLIYGGSDEVAGPLCIATAAALQANALEATLPAGSGTAVALAERMAGTPLVLVIARGRRQVWSGGARLVGCRIPIPGDPVTIRLRLDETPGRTVRRHFRTR